MSENLGARGSDAAPSGRAALAFDGRRVYPIAALLLAPASVLDVLSRNVHQATLADAMPALLGTTACAVLVWLAVVALRRRADAGAALIAGVWVFGSLFYIEWVRHLNVALGGDYTMLRTLPFALAVLIALTFALRGTRRWHAPVNTVVSCIAVALIAFPIWHVAAFEWRNGAARQVYDADRAEAELPPPVQDGAAPAVRPDIYHFVFDRYGSEETLTQYFGIREPVGDFLESRGFYVARDSFANYISTGHSLASTFYMDYLTEVAADPRVNGNDWHPLFGMMDDSRVGRFLRAQGYEHLQFGSWWVGTFNNHKADHNYPFGFSEFNMTYLRRTMLMPVFHLLPDVPLTMRLNWDNGQCQRIARQIEEIKRIGPRDHPVYVLAHILVPHGPFVFDPEGRCLDHVESAARGDTQGYAEQIAYADKIIRDVVTTLQAEDRPPAVVLIQADEGPLPEHDPNVPWEEATDEDLRFKFGILNAFYLPGGDYSRLRQDISPVNSYRVVLGELFGMDLPDLPDRIYSFPGHQSIYDFHDVTDRVRCAAPADSTDSSAAEPPARPVRADYELYPLRRLWQLEAGPGGNAWRRPIRTTAGSTGRSS